MHHKKHLPVKMFFGMNFLNFQYNFFDILNSKSLFPVKYYNADSVTHGSTSNRATIIKRMYDTYFTNKQNLVLFFGIRYSQGYYYFYIMYSVTTRVYVLEVSYYLDAGTMIWQRDTDSGDFEAKS